MKRKYSETGKVYYGTTNNSSREIATIGDIPDISDLVTTTELNNTLADYAETSDIGNGTITINQGGVLKGTFTTNQSGNTTIDLDAGGSSSYTAGTGIDITNDTISIDTDVVAQLSDIPDVSDFVDTTTLTNTLSDYVQTTTLATVATTGSYNNLIDTPTIPTVNNPTITFTQGGVSKGTITLNQSSNQTIALDAGGGGVTNPITLSETVGTNVNSLELGIETDNGNPVLHYERVVNSGGSSYTLNYNLLRYATAKSNGGLKDNWTSDFIGCSANQLEVKVDNNTIKINGSGEIYVDASSSGIIDADTLNDAMDNKEDVFDRIISPLAVTYTNGLVDFNGSDCYVTSDGILTGDTEWCTVNVSADGTDIVNDYWEWHGSFKYSSISTDIPLIGLWTAAGGFALDINSSGEVYSEDDTSNILATVAADTWISFKFVHQANSNTVEVTLLNSQGVLETNSSPIDQSTTGTITDFDWRVDTTAGVEFDLSSPESYYIIIPNGSHHTFLYRDLEVDKYAFDGQWVKASSASIISSSTSLVGTTQLEYSIASIIPNDGYNYEVLFTCEGTTDSTSGHMITLRISSDIAGDTDFCRTQTRAASAVVCGGNVTLPVSTSRKIYITRNNNWHGSISNLWISAYRRLGTNT